MTRSFDEEKDSMTECVPWDFPWSSSYTQTTLPREYDVIGPKTGRVVPLFVKRSGTTYGLDVPIIANLKTPESRELEYNHFLKMDIRAKDLITNLTPATS